MVNKGEQINQQNVSKATTHAEERGSKFTSQLFLFLIYIFCSLVNHWPFNLWMFVYLRCSCAVGVYTGARNVALPGITHLLELIEESDENEWMDSFVGPGFFDPIITIKIMIILLLIVQDWSPDFKNEFIHFWMFNEVNIFTIKIVLLLIWTQKEGKNVQINHHSKDHSRSHFIPILHFLRLSLRLWNVQFFFNLSPSWNYFLTFLKEKSEEEERHKKVVHSFVLFSSFCNPFA